MRVGRIEGVFLRSVVARRVLLLFVLAAFLPSALMALMGRDQVREMVGRNVQRQLDQTSSAYGRSLFDRLLAAEMILAETARQLRAGRPSVVEHSPDRLGRFFRGISLRRGESIQPIFGSAVLAAQLEPEQRTRLAQGKAQLLTGEAAGPTLVTAVDAADAGAGLLFAVLDADFLWGDKDTLPAHTDICVLDARRNALYCSDPARQPLAAGLADGAAPGAVAATGLNAGTWSLFLKASFGAGDWQFLAIQPREVGQEAVANITRIFGYIGLVTVLLVGLLSMVQIRRILGPIERLIDATRQLRNGRLEHPVRIERNDEFGQLAESFNGMAGRLAFQFDALSALSAIDGQILAHADVDEVIGAAQLRLLHLDGVSCAGVFVVDRDARDSGTLFMRRSAAEPMTSIRVPLEHDRFPAGAFAEAPTMFDASSEHPPTIVMLLQRLTKARCCVVHAGQLDEFGALLVLGLADDKPLQDDLLQHARALGDRIVIALAASAREEQLVYQARHDALTKLPNRMLLLDRMALELAHARREKTQLAVMFIDLDRFKYVNDVLGHAAGDQLLTAVGGRLLGCVRDSDTVARLGGDEFVVMLSGSQSLRDVARVAEQLLRALALPIIVAGKELSVGASIGIAMAPADGDDPAHLLKHADIAMYRAKDGGRGRFVFFEERMNAEVVERANIERELRLALRRGQLSVVYQPRVSIQSGRLRGVEALVRWSHPELGSVAPSRFIPIAEEIGVIQEIGRWVLRIACEQAQVWRAAGIELENVSVNVSGAELLTHGWLDSVSHALAETGLPSDVLELEVTENVLLDNEDAAIEVMNQVKRLGVRLALDDFGTGFSSMGYLRRMPVDVMKIDATFVADLEHDESSRGIARAIIAMARSLHMSVVAEGIESRGQAEMLRQWSCDEAQGFYYGKPVAPAAIAALATNMAAAAVHGITA